VTTAFRVAELVDVALGSARQSHDSSPRPSSAALSARPIMPLAPLTATFNLDPF